ncbi:MAG TPA: alpha-amylase/4-alpha-glucanotransferase domain-containing protein, partial [Candidatus Limnocylindrales bacterium]|nr:alpha-amylase/4-alpha-glucanotransferase domain-containing protein [Candidatus Limnocylindrales bacterium]
LFGGIYIAHMRAATFEHLIAAEDLADTALGRLNASASADLDLDGRDEVRLATAGQVVTVDLDEGAGIGSWDLRAPRHALAAVLRRRPERYHALLREQEDAHRTGVSGDESKAAASIHDLVRTKEPGLANLLRYDAYERRSGLLRALPARATAADWAAGGGADLGTPDAPASLVELGARRLVTRCETAIGGQPVAIRRELELGGGRLDPTVRLTLHLEHRGDAALRARLGLEWALTMLGGGGNPAAWWEAAGIRSRHDGTGTASAVRSIAQGNDWLGVSLEADPDPAADAWWAPIETISNSEGGFERVYQGSALLLSWPVELEPGGTWSASVVQRAVISTERG